MHPIKNSLFLLTLLFLAACTKTKESEMATWEKRPQGKQCSPRQNRIDFEDPHQFYNKDHVYCIALEMEADDFETMRYESRFGPVS